MNTIEKIIEKLNLQPHPEGGYFKETYRSEGVICPDSLSQEYGSERNYSTCIYFLLTSENFSAFHKIHQDEIWHFYTGSTIELHTISPNGKHEKHLIGNDFSKDEKPQLVVDGGDWFAAKVIANDAHALVGCTVAPGFDFSDFTLATRDELTELFPQHKKVIEEFTRE